MAAPPGGAIKGVVVDKITRAPLPGVNIVVEGTLLGTASNAQGNFQIKDLPPGTYNLIFSFVGYADVRLEKLSGFGRQRLVFWRRFKRN